MWPRGRFARFAWTKIGLNTCWLLASWCYVGWTPLIWFINWRRLNLLGMHEITCFQIRKAGGLVGKRLAAFNGCRGNCVGMRSCASDMFERGLTQDMFSHYKTDRVQWSGTEYKCVFLHGICFCRQMHRNIWMSCSVHVLKPVTL